MQCKFYTDVHQFYADTNDVLMRHEAQNMIMLGNIIIGCEGKDKTGWRNPENWLMATISDTEGILLTALMTPPHNITLYATDNIVHEKAVKCLIDGVMEYDIPGVMTEKSLAEYFTSEYIARKGLTSKITMNQRIYELTGVNKNIKQIGTIRLLEEKDLFFFPYWLEAFTAAENYGATEMPIPHNIEIYNYLLSKRNIYVLEDNGVPVSMAGYTRKMHTAIGVAYVYTPPYYCRKGYATSCVAQISQLALEKGFTRCILYTDLANPTSNSIYQKIGYMPVINSVMVSFSNVR